MSEIVNDCLWPIVLVVAILIVVPSSQILRNKTIAQLANETSDEKQRRALQDLKSAAIFLWVFAGLNIINSLKPLFSLFQNGNEFFLNEFILVWVIVLPLGIAGFGCWQQKKWGFWIFALWLLTLIIVSIFNHRSTISVIFGATPYAILISLGYRIFNFRKSDERT